MVSFRVKRRRSRQHKKGAQLRAQLVPRKIVEVERDALERQATGPGVVKPTHVMRSDLCTLPQRADGFAVEPS